MFDEIAHKYDFVNNFISFGLHKIIKKSAVRTLEIQKSAKVLDLCCGSGDISYLLSKEKNVEQVTGIDFSQKMLEIANKKNKSEKIIYINADCTNLPFDDDIFDICTISFGLRNIKDKEKCLTEIARVLKKGGQFMHLDFVKNENITFKIYSLFVSLLTRLFGENSAYMYLLKSVENYYTNEELLNLFKKQNFQLVKVKKYVFGNVVMSIYKKQ